jgi:hypothetical protein
MFVRHSLFLLASAVLAADREHMVKPHGIGR